MFRKLLLTLPPDATLLIYMYFFLLLYIVAAALSLFLGARARKAADALGPADADADAAAAPAPESGAFEETDRAGLEEGIWLPVMSALHSLDGLASNQGTRSGFGPLLIGVFLVVLGLPLVLLVFVTASNPASSTILHPSKFMRPTVSNLLVLSATVAEAVQLSASSFQVLHHALVLLPLSIIYCVDLVLCSISLPLVA